MNDAQLLRYSRHIVLPEMDIAGQKKLQQSKVLLIGVGGLGSPVALYLAAAGVGQLTLADGAKVDLPDLQRQIIYNASDVDRLKVEAAKKHLLSLNPEIQVNALPHRLSDERLTEQVALTDIVVDASDNFTTRFAINRACVQAGKPLVSGAAIGMQGQVAVFYGSEPDLPCYACLYEENNAPADRCAESGVLGPLVGVIGSLQAVEAIKVLLGIGESLCGYLLRVNALDMAIDKVKLRKDPQCVVCSPNNSNRA